MSRLVTFDTLGHESVAVYVSGGAELRGVRSVDLDSRTAALSFWSGPTRTDRIDSLAVPIERLTVDARYLPAWAELFGELPEWVVGVMVNTQPSGDSP